MKNRQRFREAINEFYSREVLFKLYKKYFLDWIAEGFIGSNLGLFEISLITEQSNKQTFLDLLEQMFKVDNFLNIYSILPEELRVIFETIAWKGKYSIKENKKNYFKKESSYDLKKDLKDEYLFFRAERSSNKEEYLTLDYNIIRELRKLLPKKPTHYDIHSAPDIKAEFIRNDEKIFMENIKMYYDFFKQGGVEISASGKILKESKISMKKYCGIEEYYEDIKDLQYLKTETIALFFYLLDEKYLSESELKVSNFKDLILKFLSGTAVKKEKFHYSFLYLNYLKGVKNINSTEERLEQGLRTIVNVIKEFPTTAMYDPKISLENIIKRIIYQDDFIEIIPVEEAFEYLYINEANYERTKITTYEKYLQYVVIPFIKSVFFILAVMGVVEIGYDSPSMNNSLYLKNGHLSKYDGLKYVKLTEFGKYIFGIIDHYDFKELKEDGEVVLEDDRFILSIIGDAPAKAVFFEKISLKIAPNKYKITKESILKDINSTEELKERIRLFREKISGEIYPNWEALFSELLENATKVKISSEYIVLKLENDKNLLTLLTRDERFKKLVLKCEDYHVLVKVDNFIKLVQLFKEFGYSIDSLNV